MTVDSGEALQPSNSNQTPDLIITSDSNHPDPPHNNDDEHNVTMKNHRMEILENVVFSNTKKDDKELFPFEQPSTTTNVVCAVSSWCNGMDEAIVSGIQIYSSPASSFCDDDDDSISDILKSIANHQKEATCRDDGPPITSFDVSVHGTQSDSNEQESIIFDGSTTNIPLVVTIDNKSKKLCYGKACRGCRHKKWFALILATILASFGFCIGVYFTIKQDDKTDTTVRDNSMDHSVTSMEKRIIMKRNCIVSLLGIDPLPTSFQKLAVDFLASQDREYILPLANITALWNRTEQNGLTDVVTSYVYRRLVQRYALLTIYYATGKFSEVGGWGTMSGTFLHECQWPGNHCDGDGNTDYITSIETSARIGTMRGSIPSEIGLLTDLEKIQLNQNFITGEIPSEIYALSSIYSINFANNNLSSTISAAINKLPNLRFLDFTNSGVRGTIPTEIGQLSLLKFFRIAGNEGIDGLIPSEIGNLTLIEHATFYQTRLKGTVPNSLCSTSAKRNGLIVANSCNTTIGTGSLQCDCCNDCFPPDP